ncbi:MAG: hypothetical protein GY928_02105 [Colwellia sp.]|nr:hypothetical protein [Colwellia sp.]
MELEKIIEQLSKVNRQLNQGDLRNPAIIKDGKLVFEGTHTENMEIFDMIGKWSYERENKKTEDLVIQKTMLEDELRVCINKT